MELKNTLFRQTKVAFIKIWGSGYWIEIWHKRLKVNKHDVTNTDDFIAILQIQVESRKGTAGS